MSGWITPPECRATGIGALPHTDPRQACDDVSAAFPHFPYIPTLPNRGLMESIVFCDSSPLPGGEIREGRLSIDYSRDIGLEMERIYLDFLEKNTPLGNIRAMIAAAKDEGRYGWYNNEPLRDYNYHLAFLLTGNRRIWEQAEAMSRHVFEVDVRHASPQPFMSAGASLDKQAYDHSTAQGIDLCGRRHNCQHWADGYFGERVGSPAGGVGSMVAGCDRLNFVKPDPSRRGFDRTAPEGA